MAQPQNTEPNNSTTASRWTDIPFPPRRLPFFYGWIIVTAATIGMVASIPGQTVGVGVFTDKLIEALSLTRTQISLAYMLGTIASSLLLPFAGSLTDRLGTRAMVTLSAVGLGLSLWLFSGAARIAGWLPRTALVVTVTACLFLFIRFFGQGCLTMVSRITIGKWFNHRRGLASGISSVFVAFTFNASPAFLNNLVQAVGWKAAYLVLAAVSGAGMAAVGWIFYRDNPEQCGLVMDGRDDPAWIEKVAARVPETVREFTRSQAVKTLSFWSYAAVTGWQALLMTAVTFHITSFGREVGLDRDQSFAVFPIIGIASVGIVIVGGWLSDHIRLKWLLQATIVGQFLLALGLLDLSAPLGRLLFTVGYAISGGLFGILLAVVWPRYFGRQHLGAISGLTTSILVFSSAVGPFLFSALRDWTDSFRLVTILSILVPVLFILPAIKVENPQTRLRREREP